MLKLTLLALLVAVATGKVTKVKDISCQDGGNAGCLAACLVKGFNCGFCSGSEPYETCICEHCPKVMTEKGVCSLYGCSYNCSKRHCLRASCGNNTCTCDECLPTEKATQNTCNTGKCTWDCAGKGCTKGVCENNQCTCESCPLAKLEQLTAPKPQDLSCTNGGKAACILSCKAQGWNTGSCFGPAGDETCVCSGH
jgi:hypothetical protein